MVTIFAYEMKIPDDTPDEELEAYRAIAIDLWRTSSETMGAWGAAPTAKLVHVEDPGRAIDPATGETVGLPHRVWRVEGSVV